MTIAGPLGEIGVEGEEGESGLENYCGRNEDCKLFRLVKGVFAVWPGTPIPRCLFRRREKKVHPKISKVFTALSAYPRKKLSTF